MKKNRHAGAHQLGPHDGFAYDDGGTLREILSPAEAKAMGLDRWFSGRPCKRGHVSLRYIGVNGNGGWKDAGCVTCQTSEEKREYGRQQRQRRQELSLAELATWLGPSVCTDCGVELVLDGPEANWREGNARTARRLCSCCDDGRGRSWANKNPDRKAARTGLKDARRRGAKLPKGLSSAAVLDLVEPLYAEARRRTDQTEQRYSVGFKVSPESGGSFYPDNLEIKLGFWPGSTKSRGARARAQDMYALGLIGLWNWPWLTKVEREMVYDATEAFSIQYDWDFDHSVYNFDAPIRPRDEIDIDRLFDLH